MPFAVLDTVETPYGPGYIKAVRSDEKDYVVLLRNWQLAQGQSPTCYLAEDQMKPRTEEMVNAYIGPNPPEAKGGPLKCKVLRERSDGSLICQPVSWQLADYSPDVFLHLNPESVFKI
jgi:hypothetical protein